MLSTIVTRWTAGFWTLTVCSLNNSPPPPPSHLFSTSMTLSYFNFYYFPLKSMLTYSVVLVSAAQQSELVFKLKFSEPPSCNPETIFVIFPPAKKNEFYWVKSVACKGYCLFVCFFLLSNIVVGMGRKIFSTNGAGTTGYPWEEWWEMNLDPASHHTPLFGMDRRFYQAQNPELRSFWKKA